MGTRIRILALVLLAAMLLGALPVAAAEGGPVLLLQAGGSRAAWNGRVLDAPPSRYAANGALLVPVRTVAEVLGGSVAWEGATKSAVVSLNGHAARFTRGSWTCWVDGRAATLSTPADTVDNVLYIPLTALELLGLSTASCGYYEGAYLAVSAAPLSQEALAQAMAQAPALLGPNAGLLDRRALVLRTGSRWAVRGGREEALCGLDGGSHPYAADSGLAMVPLAFSVEALGGTYTVQADGSVLAAMGTRRAAFSAGSVIVDGQALDHPYVRVEAREGTLFASLYAVTTALGVYGYAGSDGGLVLSPWPLDAALEARGLARASQLRTVEDETVKGYIALTFDDGPSGAYTTRLLDGLKARGVHATFFLCNYRIQAYPQLLSRYGAEGHEVANHSATHATLTACSPAALAAEMDNTNRTIEAATGLRPTLLRPPGGAYNQTVLDALEARGMCCVLWSVDPQDWRLRNREKIREAVLSTVGDGDIVLLHDMSNASVDAALDIIDTLQARGYRFVTVSELAALRGVPLAAGGVYRGF